MGDLAWKYPEPVDFDDDDRNVIRKHFDGRVIAHQDEGAMVRAVIPVVLDAGHSVMSGVWTGLHQADHRVLGRLETGWDGSRSEASC